MLLKHQIGEDLKKTESEGTKEFEQILKARLRRVRSQLDLLSGTN